MSVIYRVMTIGWGYRYICHVTTIRRCGVPIVKSQHNLNIRRWEDESKEETIELLLAFDDRQDKLRGREGGREGKGRCVCEPAARSGRIRLCEGEGETVKASLDLNCPGYHGGQKKAGADSNLRRVPPSAEMVFSYYGRCQCGLVLRFCH